MNQFNAIEVYTVVFLCLDDRYLLLQRSPNKTFAPLRWTGIGGHVEPTELSSLRASALREVWEESGIEEKDIQNFILRRVLLTSRPGSTLGVLLYFTGELHQYILPTCPEGQLFWLSPDQFKSLDIIETTRPVLNCLVEDIKTDPHGSRPISTGLGIFNTQGSFQGVYWG
jgi:8-oxo-dGTP diphosphatase